jgi:hypothetical protein
MIVIGGVFGSHLEPDMQVYAALFVVAVMIVAHLVASPYDKLSRHHAVLNWLEFGSLCACWATLYSGMLFFIGDKGRIDESSLMWLSIGVIAANASFTVFFALLYARYAIHEKRRGGVADMRRRVNKMNAVRHVALVGRAGSERSADTPSLRTFSRRSSRTLNIDLAREAQVMDQALTNFQHHVHHKSLHTNRIGRRKSQAKDRLKRRLKDRQGTKA